MAAGKGTHFIATALYHLKTANMTPTIVTLITAIIAALLVIISLGYYRKQTKAEGVYISFKNAATAFNLSFTKQEVLGNRVIGIDAANNKLLFLEARGNKHDGYLINLDEIKGCSVKRVYGAMHTDGSNLESYVNSVALKLDYKNGAKPTVLIFYDRTINAENEMRERATQAKAWQALLSMALIKISNRPERHKKSVRASGPVMDFAF
jgi:hypothetical protein